MPSGAIAAIVIGCLAAVVAIIVSFLLIRHFRNRSQPPIRKDTSASTQQIMDPENPEGTYFDNRNRPPAPIPPKPEPQLSDSEGYYEDPDELRRSREASVSSIPWPAPYEEIRIRGSDKPPTPERKLSTIIASGLSRTSSLPPSTNDGRRKSVGDHSIAPTKHHSVTRPTGPIKMYSIESRLPEVDDGRRTLVGITEPSVDLIRNTSGPRSLGPIRMNSIGSEPPELPKKRRPSVVPSPLSISEKSLSTDDKSQTVSPFVNDNQERHYGNISQTLPEQNDSLATSASLSTDESAKQNVLGRPTPLHRDSGDSISLDPHGYIELISENAAV